MDTAAQTTLLGAWFGSGKAAGVPATWDIEFWIGHPATGSPLLDSASAAVTVAAVPNDSTNWTVDSSGAKHAPTLPGSGDYSGEATHFRLVSGGVEYFVGELDDPVAASTDTTTVTVTLEEDA